MSISGLSHVNLRANRALLDKLRDFYIDVVGLSAGERPPFKSFGYWLYADERPIVHLVEAPAGEVSAVAKGTTLDHVAFAVSQLDDVESRLRQNGVDYERRQVPLTDQHQLFFKDPAGNGVELIFDARDDL